MVRVRGVISMRKVACSKEMFEGCVGVGKWYCIRSQYGYHLMATTHISTSFVPFGREHICELFLCLCGGIPLPIAHIRTEGSTERRARRHCRRADGDDVA